MIIESIFGSMNLMFNVFQNDMVCLANHNVQSVPVRDREWAKIQNGR